MNIDFSVHAGETANHSLNLTFTKHGDFYLLDLEVPEAPRVGKFGAMRHDHLRTWHRGIFDAMLLKGTLNSHLEKIDRQANEMLELLIRQLSEREGISERFKTDNQMEWIRRMNSIRESASEIVEFELIFV